MKKDLASDPETCVDRRKIDGENKEVFFLYGLKTLVTNMAPCRLQKEHCSSLTENK